jgi:hypothetical protein
MIWLILLGQLLPLAAVAAAGVVGFRLFMRPYGPAIARREAWREERKAIEAELVLWTHRQTNFDQLRELQGRLAAHDVLEPALPRWMFWVR